LVSILANSGALPFDLTLVRVTPHLSGINVSPGLSGLPDIWLDHMPNNLAWPIFSAKLKEIVDNHLNHDEDVYWISANVSGCGESREYYVPRLGTMHDVLDNDKTSYVTGTGHVIRPWFAATKLNNLSIFPLPQEYDLWKITSSLYFRESLKRAMEMEGVTGVAFEQVRVS
jgi:hypothetical protein